MIGLHWKLPNAPLRTSVARTLLFGPLAVLALAAAARVGLNLSESYPLKAAAPFAVVMVMATGFVREHHPFDRFGPGNTMTTVRAALMALVASLIGESAAPIVAAAAVIATLVVSALDGLDGWLARRTRMVSDFGARFDMETDALLVMALAILAWQHGKAGVWVILCGLMRYLFVAAGWLWPWLRGTLPPSKRRQTICVVQVVGLALTIVPAITPPLSSLLAGITLSTLGYSFLVDVVWLRSQPDTRAENLERIAKSDGVQAFRPARRGGP